MKNDVPQGQPGKAWLNRASDDTHTGAGPGPRCASVCLGESSQVTAFRDENGNGNGHGKKKEKKKKEAIVGRKCVETDTVMAWHGFGSLEWTSVGSLAGRIVTSADPMACQPVLSMDHDPSAARRRMAGWPARFHHLMGRTYK